MPLPRPDRGNQRFGPTPLLVVLDGLKEGSVAHLKASVLSGERR